MGDSSIPLGARVLGWVRFYAMFCRAWPSSTACLTACLSDAIDLAQHVAALTDEYNMIRPHEALDWQRPLDTHLSGTTLKPNPPETEQET